MLPKIIVDLILTAFIVTGVVMGIKRGFIKTILKPVRFLGSFGIAVGCASGFANSVISPHMYRLMPCEEIFEPWLALSKKFNLPLWLGETGRGRPEWFTAAYTMALQLGIGVNFWPWKRTAWKVGACSNPAPDGWEEIVAYTRGGKPPGYERSQKLLDEFLENMLYENCDKRENVVAAVLRRPNVRVPAIAFDVGCRGLFGEKNDFNFRNSSGYKIELKEGRTLEWLPSMDICEVAWDALTLVLREGETVSYTAFSVPDECPLFVEATAECDTVVNFYQNGMPLSSLSLSRGKSVRAEVARLRASDHTQITLTVTRGSVKLDAIAFGDIKASHYDSFLEIEMPKI